MLFCIGLCSSVLYYALLYWIMLFCIGLCSSVLNYGKVNYAYVISFMALTEQNLDDRVGNGPSVSKWRTRGNCVAARYHIRNVLFDILRQLESGNSSSDTLDHVQYRIDCLYETRCPSNGITRNA